MKYNPDKREKEGDAERLTEIISAEIQKKYKEKLISLLSIIEQNSGKYKSQIYGIRKMVLGQKVKRGDEMIQIQRGYKSEQNMGKQIKNYSFSLIESILFLNFNYYIRKITFKI